MHTQRGDAVAIACHSTQPVTRSMLVAEACLRWCSTSLQRHQARRHHTCSYTQRTSHRVVDSPPAIIGAARPHGRPQSQRSAHHWAGVSKSRKPPNTRCRWLPPTSSNARRPASQMLAKRNGGETRSRAAYTLAPLWLHRWLNWLAAPRHNLSHTTWAAITATTRDSVNSSPRPSAAAGLPVVAGHTLLMKL